MFFLTDLQLIDTQAISAQKTGMIILGGGLIKHHIANANLMVRKRTGINNGFAVCLGILDRRHAVREMV